jgi:hypothetical protein
MIFQDINPETALDWANEINWPLGLKPQTDDNLDVLVETVDVVEWCLAQEFDIDRRNFLVKHGYWPRTWEEEQRALIFLKNYDVGRKNRMKDCIANKTLVLLNHYDEQCRKKIALTLWSACIRTAKTLSIQAENDPNESKNLIFIEYIHPKCDDNAYYRIGVEIAAIWRPDPSGIDFVYGVPYTSPARRYEYEWSLRKGSRDVLRYSQE